MKERTTNTHAGATVTLKRRDLLCAAAAAGGAIIAAGTGAATLPASGTAIPDPELRAAMLKYGGEFGQLGKGDSHGDL